MLNGKFICIKGYEDYSTKDKVYEIIDGRITWDCGTQAYNQYASVESFNRNCVTQIAPYKEIIKNKHLTVGRVVEMRDGTMAFVLPDRLITHDGWVDIKDFDNNMISKDGYKDFDIIEIFDSPINGICAWNFDCEDKEHLVSVWKREDRTPQQIEIERIETEMRKLADELNKLKGQ